MLANSLSNMNLGQNGIIALLGYAVVFFGLILLMLVVIFMGKCFSAASKKAASTETSAVIQTPPAPAPGSAGQLKLHNVDPKTAAMLMAIVANKLDKPINELRFISIKEVTQ